MPATFAVFKVNSFGYAFTPFQLPNLQLFTNFFINTRYKSNTISIILHLGGLLKTSKIYLSVQNNKGSYK